MVIKNEKMEVKKLNKKLPNKFKTIWFLWPTDNAEKGEIIWQDGI